MSAGGAPTHVARVAPKHAARAAPTHARTGGADTCLQGGGAVHHVTTHASGASASSFLTAAHCAS